MLFLTAIDTLAQGHREAGRPLLHELSTRLEHTAHDALLPLSQCVRHAQEHGWLTDVSEQEGTPARGYPPLLAPPYVLNYTHGRRITRRCRSAPSAAVALATTL